MFTTVDTQLREVGRSGERLLLPSAPGSCPLLRALGRASPAATAQSSGGGGRRQFPGWARCQLLVSPSMVGAGLACFWLACTWIRLACTSGALGTMICSTPSCVEASTQDGVLQIMVPKAPEVQAKRIQVHASQKHANPAPTIEGETSN